MNVRQMMGHEISVRAYLYAGGVATLADGTSSAISKTPLQDRCYISPIGIRGDVCADTRYHGGSDRALLFYPREHYDTLKRRFPLLAPLSFGDLGENISAYDLPESEVCIGDIFSLGDAVIEVNQPRSPCFKLGIRCGEREAPRVIQDMGLTGYFFRVLKSGECDPVADLILMQRREPSLTVEEAGRIYFSQSAIKSDLEKLAASPGLCLRWKDKIKKRLAGGAADSSMERLYGSTSLESFYKKKSISDKLAHSTEEAATVSYIPIDCDLHDYLEIAGTKSYPIRVSCMGGASWTIKVRDLITKTDKSEWLLGVEVDTAVQREIRLDHIRDIKAVVSNDDFSFVRFK